MALTDKLSAIGDAIRAKTGDTALLKLDDMPIAIASIETGSTGTGGDDDTLKKLMSNTLTSIKIPDGVTTLRQHLFYGATTLKSVDLNDVRVLEEQIFNSCSNLTDIDTSKLKTIYGYCFAKTPITYLNVSSLVETVYSGGTTNTSPNVFNNMNSLEEIEGFGLTVATASMFANCYKLKKIDLSSLEYIKGSAFNNCNSLEEIVLPNVIEIGSSAFGCSSSYVNTSLKKIDIGANCTKIDSNAFAYCPKVETLIIRATTPPTLANVNAFNSFVQCSSGQGGGYNSDDDITCYIYVPAESYSTYMNTTNWTTFVNSGVTYRKIEDYPEITGG